MQQDKKMITLYLLKFFLEETNEQKFASYNDIISYISKISHNELTATKATIRSTIELLNDFFDLHGINKPVSRDLFHIYKYEPKKGEEMPEGCLANTVYYYMAYRRLEVAEAQIAISCIQSSSSVDSSIAQSCIDAILSFFDRYQKKELAVNMSLPELVRTSNPIAISVDVIMKAIANKKKISFNYIKDPYFKRYSPKGAAKKELYSKTKVSFTTVSPYKIYAKGGKNYLACKNDEHENPFSHYRIDRIYDIKPCSEDAVPLSDAEGLREDISSTSAVNFGESSEVVFEVSKTMNNIVYDRYGETAVISSAADGSKVRVSAHDKLSEPFYNWLVSLGGSVQIIAPGKLKSAMEEKAYRIYCTFAEKEKKRAEKNKEKKGKE